MITGIPRTSLIPYVMLVLLIAAFLLVVTNVPALTLVQTSQVVSKEWQKLVDAINAGNQVEAEAIAEWLETHGKGIELGALEEVTGRFICAWCLKDLGPAETPEDSPGICSECGKTFLGQ